MPRVKLVPGQPEGKVPWWHSWPQPVLVFALLLGALAIGFFFRLGWEMAAWEGWKAPWE